MATDCPTETDAKEWVLQARYKWVYGSWETAPLESIVVSRAEYVSLLGYEVHTTELCVEGGVLMFRRIPIRTEGP